MAETAIAKPKKQRNYAVDFWRFFATLAVFWGHYQLNYRFTFRDCGQKVGPSGPVWSPHDIQ